MTAQPVETGPDAPVASLAGAGGLTRSGVARIDGIDALRGLVIVLMVLDHVRDFFHRTALTADPLALDSGDPALFMTRWITHLCAPTFVFLAGVSVWLQRANGKPLPDLSRFLLTRGLWLIVLELTVVGVGFGFGWWIFLQVIWAIGAGMIVLAGLVWLPRAAVLALGVAIMALHPLLGVIPADGLGALAGVWRPLAVFGPMQTSAGFMLVAYPAIPWIGALLVGYGLGGVFAAPETRRRRGVLALALGALALFAVLRAINLPGLDPRAWAVQAEPLWTAFSIIDVSKYPPSPGYMLLTLGVSLLIYLALERARGRAVGVLTTFGRTPLFTYLLHIWIAHALALLTGVAMGVPASAFFGWIVDPSRLIQAGWGVDLWAVYGFWLLTLALLYPLSRGFEALKRRRRDWWLGYL